MSQMDKLAALVCGLVRDIHYKKALALAEKASDLTAADADQLEGYFGHQQTNHILKSTLSHWRLIGCSGPEFAALISGAAWATKLSEEHKSEELVWTGPDLGTIPVRRSEQVVLDLINTAESHIFIISFVLINIPEIESALRTAALKGVKVSLLLESEDKNGTNDFRKSCVRIKSAIPQLELYIWPRENRQTMEGGFARVHAKCVIADSNRIFITSANLTSTALDKNIEMGILTRGGNLPVQASDQFNAMISQNEIIKFSV
jgi:cardiolipin synthase